MSIMKLYVVSVDIPESVWSDFGYTHEYKVKVLDATAGSVSSGSDEYSTISEWAEFHTLEQAQNCERKLMEMIRYFAAKVLH